MYVRGLELIDFRSYQRVVVDLEPGVTVFVGPNGIGKTNLIEALGYLATLSSHRVATDAPLIRVGAPRAMIRSTIVNDGRELLAELAIEPGKANRARLGRSALPRVRDLLGALRMVLFAPEDLAIVRGDPGERRRFLDDLLVARRPRLAGVRSDYDRVLKQRNALLRTAYLARRTGGSRDSDLSTLDVWDAHLARHGAQVLAARLELCAALQPHLASAYQLVSAGRSAAGARYVPSTPDPVPAGSSAGGAAAELEAWLTAALLAGRKQEIERGVTLVGPHRDELALSLGDLPVRGYASHGESWSFALALRLASFELLRSDGIEPILVLDDVFAELDTGRRERLARTVGRAEQVLVTCAVDDDVPTTLRGLRYEVLEGEVRRL